MDTQTKISRITHAYAHIVHNGEVCGKVHITDTKGKKYGADFKFFCADGHEMYPRAVNGIHNMAPHFVHKSCSGCTSRVTPEKHEGETELHRVVKRMLASRFGLTEEFAYVEEDVLKTGKFRSDAGKPGFYYEVSWKSPLKKNYTKFKYIQSIVNKGATVIEVRLNEYFDSALIENTDLLSPIIDENFSEQQRLRKHFLIQTFLQEPELLWQEIERASYQIKKKDEVIFKLEDSKSTSCKTGSYHTVSDDEVRVCKNCSNRFTRISGAYDTTYHKCVLYGLKRVDLDISLMGTCENFAPKTI